MSDTKESVELFGERLNEAMRTRKITARVLSSMTGISESNVSRYRRGQYAPKRENIYKIAKALNVNPMWLLGFSDVSQFNGSEEEQMKIELANLVQQMDAEQVKKTISFVKQFIL